MTLTYMLARINMSLDSFRDEEHTVTDDNADDAQVLSGRFKRRNVVKAATVAGLLGIAGTTRMGSDGEEPDGTDDIGNQTPPKSNSADTEANPEPGEEQIESSPTSPEHFNMSGRLVVGESGYDTVQAAWNDAVDGDVVYVHSSYDAKTAGEDFPIVIDQRQKEVALMGGHPSGSEINASHAPDRNIIEVYGIGPSDYRNTPLISRLKLVGGNVGILVAGAPNASFSHVSAFLTNSHGFSITTTSSVDNGSHGTRWYDCEAWSCGGVGFNASKSASPHGATFIRCNSTWNGWNGNHPGVRLYGYSSVWQSGTIQRNSAEGIQVRDDGSQVIRDTYFESNGLESSTPVHFAANGTMGLVLEGCYFQGGMYSASSRMSNVVGHNNVYRAVVLNNARTSSVRGCSFRNHQDGFIAIEGPHSLDNDLYEHSHHNIANSDSFLAGDSGSRTRSNGMIIEQDLRRITGKYTGDQGLHNGSGSAPWGPAVWNGSGWVSVLDGTQM